MESQVPELHKRYDLEHFVEMVLLSYEEERIEYYPNGKTKRKLETIFCNQENQYCLLETNYNDDGSLLNIDKGYTYRKIYDKKTIGYYKK